MSPLKRCRNLPVENVVSANGKPFIFSQQIAVVDWPLVRVRVEGNKYDYENHTLVHVPNIAVPLLRRKMANRDRNVVHEYGFAVGFLGFLN